MSDNTIRASARAIATVVAVAALLALFLAEELTKSVWFAAGACLCAATTLLVAAIKKDSILKICGVVSGMGGFLYYTFADLALANGDPVFLNHLAGSLSMSGIATCITSFILMMVDVCFPHFLIPKHQ